MSGLALEAVLADLRQLPPLPAVVMELLETLGSEEVNTECLASKISRDQALAARALRVANSPFYGLQGQIGTLRQAVVVLGIQNVRTLVTAAGIVGQFPACPRFFDRRSFWQHSLGVALTARVLARRTGANQEIAFISGLLHDIGRMALVVCRPAEYLRALETCAKDDTYMLDAERAVLGFDHAAVGEGLAERWKFPAAIRRAVGNHHAPDAGQPDPYTDLVHVADILCRALDLGTRQDDRVPNLSPAAWSRLGLDWRELRECLGEIEAAYQGAVLLLE